MLENNNNQEYIKELNHLLFKSFPPQGRIHNKYIKEAVLEFKEQLKNNPPKNEEEFLNFKNDFVTILKENELFLDYKKSENIIPEKLSIRDVMLSATIKKPDFFDEKIFDYDTKNYDTKVLDIQDFSKKTSSIKNKTDDISLKESKKINFTP